MPKIEALDGNAPPPNSGLSHQAIEDYLKTIYHLSDGGTLVSTSELALARGVKQASATGMVKRLAELNLVNYKKHSGVSLTESGEKIALEVIRHHRLIETYLIEALGFTWDEVHEQADILEHVISEKLEERIASALNHPKFDPHGAPIPNKDGSLPMKQTEKLYAMPEGSEGVIAEVHKDNDVEMLRYLAKLGIRPGVEIKVVSKAPFDGPITLKIDGDQKTMGFKIAHAISVEPKNGPPADH